MTAATYGWRKQQAYSDTSRYARPRLTRESATHAPRWVKVFWVMVLVLVLLFVIRHITGGALGGHTP
jgi:cobalamin biosynthesis Mg chelatase CobN